MLCCDAQEKYRADLARDAQRLTELKPQEQRCLASGGRTQRRPRRPHAGVPLAIGRAARELLRARAAHPAAGQHQAAGEGLGAVESLIYM